MITHKEIFACPSCGGDLKIYDSGIDCINCSVHYGVDGGIPLLFCPNEWGGSKKDVTGDMKSFYEKTPFPNYEDFENVSDLVEKAQNGVFARLLNEQTPFNIRVLEVACGTGQLSSFLGVAQRFVFGVDMCLNSLKLAQGFKEKNNLERTGFYQMNLFRPIFKDGSFPLVICNGALHHTSDPFLGFQTIAKLVKKGGYIIIGLYNKYGRLPTDARRIIFNLFSNRFKFLDPHLKRNDVGDAKKHAWFMDQYKNPHESKHTIGEVLNWFKETGFDFVNGIPKVRAFDIFSDEERLFKPNSKGTAFDHFMVQSRLILNNKSEGGFFLMIGKKR